MFAALIAVRLGSQNSNESAETLTGFTPTASAVTTETATDPPFNRQPNGESAEQTRARHAASRAERFREALAAPTPPAPAPQPSRIAAARPETKVEGETASAGVRTEPARPTPAPQQAAPPARPANPTQSSESRPAPPKQRAEPDDPDSDTQPPQVISVEFRPPQIRDGESTILMITATDDRSGVRSVSGVIASPSGAVQGFSGSRRGSTDLYVAKIAVPASGAEGLWNVRHLTLTDNASNTVTLSQATGALPSSASFRVISEVSDSSGPVLRRIWVERPAMRGAEVNTIFVEAEDDKTGLAGVSGVLISPRRQARLGFGCRAGAGDTWSCPLTAPVCLDCGVWQLEQVQLQDKAGNLATFRGSDPLVAALRLDIAAEHCDSEPPILSALVVEPAVVSNSEGGTVRVQAVVADPGCGVASLSGQAMPVEGTGGQRAYFSLAASGDGQSYTGLISIPRNAARGIWQIAWIQALDKGQNLRAYGGGDPLINRSTFRVE